MPPPKAGKPVTQEQIAPIKSGSTNECDALYHLRALGRKLEVAGLRFTKTHRSVFAKVPNTL